MDYYSSYFSIGVCFNSIGGILMSDWQLSYKKWLQDPGISLEDIEILQAMSEKEIRENFYKSLTFGTAGIRGIRGLGTNRINKYIIRKVTQGYCDFLIDTIPDAKVKGVVIAYDTRHMSRVFAEEAANVLSGNGILVYLFSAICSTPELSFAIRYLKVAGGLVLTASHNSKEYSGYKAYNKIGCQLSTEETELLTKKINKIKTFDKVLIDKEGKCVCLLANEIEAVYLDQIKKIALNSFNKDLSIMYSSLHGVGLSPIKKLLKQVGATFKLVDEQCIPDGNFPTISKPNPEEPEALNLIIKEGEKHNSELLLATDPDADRLGVMVLHQGKYIYLTGNQMGGLLIDYILKYRKYNAKNSYLLTSIVTSKFGAIIAKRYGVNTIITFTGFKNLGKKMEEFLNEGKDVLFAYEESIGYLPEIFIRDKDGISTSFLVAEMAGVLKKEGKTLIDQLKSLYKKYGYFKEKQVSYTLKGIKGIDAIRNIMAYLRDSGPGQSPDGFKLKEVVDYLETSIDSDYDNLLYYEFKDDSWIGVRPSGTEPKLKFYINTIANKPEQANLKCSILEKWLNDRIRKWLV